MQILYRCRVFSHGFMCFNDGVKFRQRRRFVEIKFELFKVSVRSVMVLGGNRTNYFIYLNLMAPA